MKKLALENTRISRAQAEKLRDSLKVSSNLPQEQIAASQGLMVGLLWTVWLPRDGECDMARTQHILKAARKSASILGLGNPTSYCYKFSCSPHSRLSKETRQGVYSEGRWLYLKSHLNKIVNFFGVQGGRGVLFSSYKVNGRVIQGSGRCFPNRWMLSTVAGLQDTGYLSLLWHWCLEGIRPSKECPSL